MAAEGGGGTGLSWFIARHYLRSGQRSGFLSLITWIALGGVLIGNTALIIVIAVMTGMQNHLRTSILESTPHVVVLETGSSLRLHDYESVIDRIAEEPGVVAVAPFVQGQVNVVRSDPGGGSYAQSADLYGIDMDTARAAPTDIARQIIEGTLDLRRTESGLPPLLMGSILAERMLLFEGDTVTLMSAENFQVTGVGVMPTIRNYELTGTFTTGMYEYDLRNVYTTLEDGQSLLGLEPQDASGIGVRASDPALATEVARGLEARLGLPYWLLSWEQQNAALFNALQLEKLGMGLVVFLIVAVAALNIVGTLVMVVADRTREIGILKTMGMSRSGILWVFMLQGVWIGAVGTTIGASLGVVVSWAVDRYELIKIPGDVYFVEHLPAIIDPFDVALIVVASLGISFLATIYPALQASRLEPVDAIRHE